MNLKEDVAHSRRHHGYRAFTDRIVKDENKVGELRGILFGSSVLVDFAGLKKQNRLFRLCLVVFGTDYAAATGELH